MEVCDETTSNVVPRVKATRLVRVLGCEDNEAGKVQIGLPNVFVVGRLACRGEKGFVW